MVIAGLTGTYSSYVTTREEYAAQRYEGASTIFGPSTLDAYIQVSPPRGLPPALQGSPLQGSTPQAACSIVSDNFLARVYGLGSHNHEHWLGALKGSCALGGCVLLSESDGGSNYGDQEAVLCSALHARALHMLHETVLGTI